MYRSFPSLLIGFHGCALETARDLVSGKAKFKPSTNDYDWLGNGMYFWENNPERAAEYARENLKRHKSKSKPAVVGAILNLGNCCNLLEKHHIDALASAHDILCSAWDLIDDTELPKNTHGPDKLLRKLDCQVIQVLHSLNESGGKQPYDSVRGVFQEGGPVYEGAGFCSKSHIQIAIRNPNCVKGFFWPRELSSHHGKV